MATSRRAKQKNRMKRKIIYTVVIASIFFLSGVIVFATYLTLKANKATTQMFVPLDRDQEEAENTKLKTKESTFTLLLAGIEHEEGEKYGRSDMLLLATVNPTIKKISMVNIPRDTRIYLEKLGNEDKINRAYSIGGMNDTIYTLEKLLDIPIDYYISTDFQGFEDIVDTVGGVDVDVPFTFKAQLTESLQWKTYTKGPMFLNGKEALAYVRMRKTDPEGDAGRNVRQKQVIQDIINKATSLSNITKIDDMIQDVGNNVQTNIPPSEYFGLLKMYQKLKTSPIEQLHLKGEDRKQYNEEAKKDIWYFFPDDDSLNELIETLKLNLADSIQSNQTEANTTKEENDLTTVN